jgi:hypothetical protein
MKLFVIIFALAFYGTLQAQVFNFKGKRHLVSASMKLRTPTIYGLFYSPRNFQEFWYKPNGEMSDPGKNMLEAGINLSYTFAVTRKVGVVLNYCNESYKFIGSPGEISVLKKSSQFNSQERLIQSTYLKGVNNYLIPGIVFSFKEGLLPFGLNQEFGFGFGTAQVKNNENYQATTQKNNGENSTLVTYKGDELHDTDYKYKFRAFYYKLKMVLPINEFIMMNVGLNYQYGYLKSSDEYPDYSDKVFSPLKIYSALKEKAFSNMANLEIGVSYGF